MLSSQSSGESFNIKAAIKSFFWKRNCFNAVAGNKGQYHRLIEYVQQATPTKTVFNKSLTGPILCSMVQTYVSRLQKKAPAVIFNAFNRAVAAESRKNIEKLYISYLERMGEVENRLPCNEEELWNTHNDLSNGLLKDFDEQMADFCECEEILLEKETVIHRMKAFYDELQQSNIKISEEKSIQLYKYLFDDILQDEDFVEKVTENEEKMISGIKYFYDNAVGPSAYKVLVDNITLIFPFFCGIIRDFIQQAENNHDDLSQEIENLKKNREKSRQNEKKLKEILDETVKNYESQLENKEKIMTDLQSNCSTRINISETKVKNLMRENKSLQQELEHVIKEKEAMIEMEKGMLSQKLSEYKKTIEKYKQENLRLEKEIEEIQSKTEKSLSAKDDELVEFKQKEKLSQSETVTESIQDFSIFLGLRQDLSDVFQLFNNEFTTNAKLVEQMDKIAALQSELNKFRLKEIEGRNKIIDDYEEKISNLKDENERFWNELEILKKNKKIDVSDSSLDKETKSSVLLESDLKRKNEEISLLQKSLSNRDEQLQNLYNVIQVHKKQFEQLEGDFEEKENDLHKCKVELVQIKDDNDILLGLMGYSLEVLQKKRNIQAINLAQIQNQNNRSRVIKIFKKFGIPFD